MIKLSFSNLSILICVTIISCFVFSNKYWRGEHKVIESDVLSYYGYLPSTFIYQDLSLQFWDELDSNIQNKIWFKTNIEEERTFKMTMGVAYFYCPLFLVAHHLSTPLGYDNNGYTLPYRLSIVLTSLLFYTLGLILIRKSLLSHFSELVTAVTILIIALGTNIVNYVIKEPGMSHVFSFFSIAAFLHLGILWEKTKKTKHLFMLGAISGLIVLIRPVNITVVLFFLFLGVYNKDSLTRRIQLFVTNYKQLLIGILGGCLVIFPQLLYWKYSTGDWVYYSYSEEGFFFTDSRIFSGLFSFRNGWLIYSPLMAFSLIGLFYKNEVVRKYRLSLIPFILVHFYIVFSWWCWWYGGSYGMRSLIDIYPLLSIPLAAFVSDVTNNLKWKKIVFTVITASLIGLNFFQFNQYKHTILHYDSMTFQAYKHIFLKRHVSEDYVKYLDHPNYKKALQGDRD